MVESVWTSGYTEDNGITWRWGNGDSIQPSHWLVIQEHNEEANITQGGRSNLLCFTQALGLSHSTDFLTLRLALVLRERLL